MSTVDTAWGNSLNAADRSCSLPRGLVSRGKQRETTVIPVRSRKEREMGPTAKLYGTLEVSNRSLFSVMELEIVLLAKNAGTTQLFLLTGTVTKTVTSLVSLVITMRETQMVASRAEIELSSAWAELRQSAAVAPGTMPRRAPS